MTPAQLVVLARQHERVQSGKASNTRKGTVADLARLASLPMGG